ncbi:probable methyltransferase-like protein 15 isoform X2 [Hypomesus transpacificus]|uniref:probable methyltransferase-like protein 15 isoform X2 n=2 Tax=Hypomesus transpacificus TaxID=137520 RepID=UPI001F080B32|nr:probable methyltransferase-like protein 15 isoform X2 [Hypomesus transpacificus]
MHAHTPPPTSPSIGMVHVFCRERDRPAAPSSLPYHNHNEPTQYAQQIQAQYMKIESVFLDMTFGGGGHTKAIAKATPDVTVLALDRDPTAFSLAHQLAEEHKGRVRPLLGRFSELEVQLDEWGLRPASVDAVLLDAGCSSMQMDRPERGFSLSQDGPLDMRMDANRYPNMPCATDVVNALDQQALASVLSAYGEEKHARKIALAIVEARSVYPITRTQQLASVVAGSFSSAALYARSDRLQRPSHIATKTFQALRMFVNDELNELHAGLRSAQTLLKPGGRLCVLTFHSLEDRLVKRFLLGEDLAAPPRRSLRLRLQQGGGGEGEEAEAGRRGGAPWVPLQRGVLTPQAEDVMENPRGRSAKLRAARRL